MHANAGFTLSLVTTIVPFSDFVEEAFAFVVFDSGLGGFVADFVPVFWGDSEGFFGCVFGVDCGEAVDYLSGGSLIEF